MVGLLGGEGVVANRHLPKRGPLYPCRFRLSAYENPSAIRPTVFSDSRGSSRTTCAAFRAGHGLGRGRGLLGGPAADTRSRCPPTNRPFGGNGSGRRAARPSWCSSPRRRGG